MNKKPNFVYVFDEAAKQKLLNLGYHYLKSNTDGDVYVFVNDGQGVLSLYEDFEFIFTDVLTL